MSERVLPSPIHLEFLRTAMASTNLSFTASSLQPASPLVATGEETHFLVRSCPLVAMFMDEVRAQRDGGAEQPQVLGASAAGELSKSSSNKRRTDMIFVKKKLHNHNFYQTQIRSLSCLFRLPVLRTSLCIRFADQCEVA